MSRLHEGRERSQPVPHTINWAKGLTRPTLMIPGPTELAFSVIQAMNAPPIVQYDASFDERVLEPTLLALRAVFQCRGEVFLLPGSGRPPLAAGAASVLQPRARAVAAVPGPF